MEKILENLVNKKDLIIVLAFEVSVATISTLIVHTIV
jgi:hypothetical protein